MQRISSLLVAGALALTACADVDKSDLENSGPTSNVKTTTTNGVVTGEFNKDATGDQVLVGSGVTGETSLTIAPGSLAIDTNISMQEGGALDSGALLPTELGLGEVAILGGSHATLLGASPSTETSSPFTLSIPLPLGDAAAASSLNLMAGEGKVGILYMVKTAAGNKIGLYILGQDDLVGTIVKYKGGKLGWFRIVVLSSAVASTEQSTTKEPPAKG